MIASGGWDKTIQLWDAVTGKVIFTYHGHSHEVTSVDWSSNGKKIASASADKTVQVWDAITGEEALTYRGHSSQVNGAAWAPIGELMASVFGDGIRAWKPS